uniref:Nostrin n=1 Tax=Phallusia mammillata TaxID=59560 RepID=A0A6F9DMQ4_9ASCI|nr:nostrin [Phallusia mammillata]
MTYFRNTFMGNAGFEELKRFTRQGTDFGREIVNVLNERATLEQYYAKGLRRLGQRINKATCGILSSPLSNAWKTVGVEMEKESEVHRDFGINLIEECIKPLSVLTEGQLKPRRALEQNVESTGKTWIDRNTEHAKIKRRLHTCTREHEALIEQINGPRPKTERDQQKLLMKREKSKETVLRADSDYYNSLLHLERSRQEWEIASFQCCDRVENMEDDRFRRLCHVVQKYTDNLYEIPSKLKATCRIIDEATENLSPSKEIQVVADKLKGVPYMSEQLLCDYYQENFSCQMSVDRRKRSVDKLLERYINDCQKERTHRDGMRRLESASLNTDAEHQDEMANRLLQSSAMLTFLDAIRHKLNCTVASLDGTAQPHHPLSNNIERHTDKQGIMYSVLRLRPGEGEEKLSEHNGERSSYRSSKSKPKSSSKSRAPTRHRSSSFEGRSHSTISAGSSSSNHHHSHKPKHFETVSAATGIHAQRKSIDLKSLSMTPPVTSSPVTPEVKLTSTPPLAHESSSSSHINGGTSSDVASDGSTILCHCIALYDYVATREDELSINEGDIISVFEKREDDWWRGQVGEKTGLFPANYVDLEISV